MLEIKWFARGGQGGFTACRLLALAAYYEKGSYAQAFPSFGPERRGAPVFGYTRLDDKPIRDHSEVKKYRYAIVLDATLIKDMDIASGLSEGGEVFVNTADAGLCVPGCTVHTYDATGAALASLGSDISNTAMLSFFCRLTGLATLQSLKRAVCEGMSERIAKKNLSLVESVYMGTAQGAAAETARDACVDAQSVSGKPAICAAFPYPASMDEMPLGPSSPAGVITQSNAGWRVRRPVVDSEKCVKCYECWVYCPEGAIDRDIHIDMDFCKGCGICEKNCPRHAISMRRE